MPILYHDFEKINRTSFQLSRSIPGVYGFLSNDNGIFQVCFVSLYKIKSNIDIKANVAINNVNIF